MKEQVEKTREFLVKQRLTLSKDLTDLKKNKRPSVYLKDLASCLLRTAKKMEDMLLNEHDPRFERVHMLIEELGEVILGLADCDEAETLDGLSDLAFVVIGTALAFDLPLIEGLNEVCKSNLTKSPRKKEDARLRDKGPDWQPPNIKSVLSLYRGIDVQAERTSCIKGGQTYTTTVHVKRRWHEELNSWWIEITRGTVTGYESMQEDHVNKLCKSGWTACAGSVLYDTLHIPAEEMQKIHNWLNG